MSDPRGAAVQPGSKAPSRHCGTGLVPDRDITGSWRDVDEPGASLPAVPPGRARAPRGNCRLFDTGRRNPARDGLSAGGNRIRTIGPALVKGLSAVADERCRTDKLDGVKHRSSRERTMVGGLPRPAASTTPSRRLVASEAAIIGQSNGARTSACATAEGCESAHARVPLTVLNHIDCWPTLAPRQNASISRVNAVPTNRKSPLSVTRRAYSHRQGRRTR